MIGPELFRLGRTLTKMGLRAIPAGGFRQLPKNVRMVLVDVHENPGSTIGAIAERTEFPQSLVSSAVARLRDEDMVVTERDPADRRRTLVAPSPRHQAQIRQAREQLASIDDVVAAELAERLGEDGPSRLPDVLAALELLGEVLLPTAADVSGGPSC